MSTPRTGAKLLVDQLGIHGVEKVFCVPGESYITVLDALHDRPDMQLVSCRHESGAAMMAEAYGKLTGQPGICMVTRGPGATNASAGLHVAMQDSTPMILFIGQIARSYAEREAFQELDYRRVFGQLAKWVAEIDDPERIPEFISRAFQVAVSGRPGPVVLSLPEDMLEEVAEVADGKPYTPFESRVDSEQIAQIRSELEQAERPLLLVGGSGWRPEAVKAIEQFAEQNNIPVAASFRRQDRVDNRHKNYIGDVGIGINPKLAEHVKNSDLLLVVGSRMSEMVTGGYRLINIPVPNQRLIHAHPDPEEVGRVYSPSLGIVAANAQVALALAEIQLPEEVTSKWGDYAQQARQDYLDVIKPTQIPGDVQMGEIMQWLSNELPEDSIICNGAGNFSTWVHRYIQYKQLGTQLAPTSGSMGYGVPASISAKLTFPERVVVAVAGDGDFLMTAQELATAKQYGANVIVIVVNNGMYGTIRMHQERHFPGRVAGTDLQNPDFVTMAKSYGAHAELVTDTKGFYPAFERCLNANSPALIEIRLDPEALTINQSLSEIRAQAQEKK